MTEPSRSATIDFWQEISGYWSVKVTIRVPGWPDRCDSATDLHTADEALDWARRAVHEHIASVTLNPRCATAAMVNPSHSVEIPMENPPERSIITVTGGARREFVSLEAVVKFLRDRRPHPWDSSDRQWHEGIMSAADFIEKEFGRV